MNHRSVWISVFVAALVGGVPTDDVAVAGGNEVLAELLDVGVPVAEGVRVRLPRATMPDGLDAEAQHNVLVEVARPRRTVAALTRNSVVTPFVLDVKKVAGAGGGSRARRIDLWFVAYGRMEEVANRDFLKQLAGAAERKTPGELPTEWHVFEPPELAERGIRLTTEGPHHEMYFHSTFPLLDRVLIRATRHAMSSRSDDSILLAARLDKRFVGDEAYPNLWRPITLDELGKPRLGPETPYTHAGFYVKATQLHEPAGALFIEYHQVYEEPKAWFHGANLLRSKLPLIVQDAVRKFRRRLKKARHAASSEDKNG